MEQSRARESQRLAAFVEDGQIGIIHEDAVTALGGEFSSNAHPNQRLHRFGGGRKRHGVSIAQILQRKHRSFSQSRQDPEGIGSRARCLLDAPVIRLEELDEPAGCLHGAVRGLLDAIEEEVEPRLPIARGAHTVEQVVIHLPVLFKIKGKIEQRLGEKSTLVQHERDEQATQTAIPVEEWMDGLEALRRTGRPPVSSCRKRSSAAMQGSTS